jgi:hypothetical protein
MKHSPALFILVLLLASCESDLITNQYITQIDTSDATGKKKLLLAPTHLEGEQYIEYEFRAKVTNVAFSDLVMEWDFDEGQGFEVVEVPVVKHAFHQPKIHFVKVRATDWFADTLLGYDSIRVDIRPPAGNFNLLPDRVDTTLAMNSNGSMASPLRLEIVTPTPGHLLTTKWDLGDGSTKDTLLPDKVLLYNFKAAGTYLVRVSGYDTSGTYVGSDSVEVTLRIPPVTAEMLSRTTAISVYLSVDTSHVIVKDPLFRNPLATTLNSKNDSVSTWSLSGTKFKVTLDSMKPPEYFFRHFQEEIEGELSTNLRSIRSVMVSVNDTGRLHSDVSDRAGLHYSYQLRDLELLAVTPNRIVYRSVSTKMNDFASNITFRAANAVNVHGGISEDFFVLIHPNESRFPHPYGLIMFDRK